MPLFDAGIPAAPLLPRLIAEAVGRLDGAMGLFCCPSAIGAGCGELLGTAAGWAWARLTILGAGGGCTILGGAGTRMGGCCTILISGGFGGSGSLISGILIFGGSTFTTGGVGSGFGGMILGLIGSGSGCLGSGARLSSVSLCLLSIDFLAAAPMMQTTMAMMMLSEIEVKSEPLLWLPSLRTPKCENCMFCGEGSSLRSGFAIKKSFKGPNRRPRTNSG